jgi:uncharacterized membrane protein
MSWSTLGSRVLSWMRPDLSGVAFAALFFCLSLTPSLLPLQPRIRRLLSAAVIAASIAASLLMVVPAAAWQRQVAALMGIEGPATSTYLRSVPVALLTGAALIGGARLVKDLIKTLARVLIRRWHINDEVALFIGTAIVVVFAITVFNGVLVRGLLAAASAAFQPQNTTTRPGVEQPQQRERSGSPESFAPWETLGFQGRNFTGTGPSAADLTALNGRPAKEPVRIYAGLQTAQTTEERVAVLLSELQRTRAFERKILVIMPTTGTGWVDPIAARAIESMYNGDTALIGMQYSYLPSWISFLADRRKSVEAGRAMIDAIHQRWAQQPEARRPTLALYGESLGSMAGQGAFGYLHDVEDMDFSSVLWVGPPNESRLWKALTARRDPGSPEVQPRYDNGRIVRFAQASSPAEIAAVAAPPWGGTRVLYLQHASDPVVWWSPELVVREPDWLKEPPGFDRSPSMRWYPIVTFFQVSADMAGNVTDSTGAPPGHGHKYGDTQLDGWVAVAAPPGWTQFDTDRMRRSLDKAMAAGGPEFA